MKLVIAVVRREQANDVMDSLERAGIHGYSITRAYGRGSGPDQVQTYRGSTIRQRLSGRTRFEIAVSAPLLPRAIEAIREGARTGEGGDGNIVVLDVEEALQIHTDPQADSALEPVA